MDNPKPPGAASELLSPEAMHWQADCEMADALSAFQSQVEPAAELTLQAVVEAAKPAFRLGFSFSVRSGEEGTTVLLRHRSGSQQSAEGEGHDDDFTLSAWLLAGLLGIPVAEAPRPSKAEEQSCADACAAPSVCPAAGAPAAESTSATPAATPEAGIQARAKGEVAGGGQPDGSSAEGLDPALEPLSAEEISTLTGMLKELARNDKEAWKQFSLAFREHFAVPRTARTITDRISQRRHADFIDRFERELAASGGSGADGAAEAI
ncbi:MAG: hypothetical protein ACK4V5_06945 [Cyanobium sp.]|jgi:hypothetical protein